MMLAFPKPKDEKRKPVAVYQYRGGREVCNLFTKAGHDSYEQRKRAMWERQGRMCCLHGHLPSCPGKLNWADTTFDHEIPRGHGAGSRDDRIEIKVKQRDGTVRVKRQNGAAHADCNVAKGSRRIDYNAAYNRGREDFR